MADMRCVVLLFCLLGTSACLEKSPLEPSPVDRQVVLGPGDQAVIAEAGISLRFEGVTGDSRCPADALCVTGGDAIVKVAVPTGNGRADYELHTGTEAPVTHGDLTISLVQLMPYPFSSRPIDPRDYRATLRVVRGG